LNTAVTDSAADEQADLRALLESSVRRGEASVAP
jgi:hypothetical protein